jgi:hypothetical protein
MDWISTLHYGTILQQERLRRARETRRGFSVPRVAKWLRAARTALAPRDLEARRATGSRRDRIAQAGGPALPTDSAPA